MAANHERGERGLAKFEEKQKQRAVKGKKERELPAIERDQMKTRECEEADRLARRELHEKTFKEKEVQLRAPLSAAPRPKSPLFVACLSRKRSPSEPRTKIVFALRNTCTVDRNV